MSGRILFSAVAIVAVLASVLTLRPEGAQAQLSNRIEVGCNQGTGLFDLFDSNNPFPFLDDKIEARNQNLAFQEMDDIRAIDPSDGQLKPVEISPGRYRIFAIAGDDHFEGRGGQVGYDEQPFESFYVEIDGKVADRPTPDRGVVGDATGLEYYVGNVAPNGIREVFDAAGYSLEDYGLAPDNNGDFDNGTDYIGIRKHSDPNDELYDALPAQLIDRSRPDFDKGANLGIVEVSQRTTSVRFYHFFHPRFGNSVTDANQTPANPNGIRYPDRFAHWSHSSHIGIIRLECISDGGGDGGGNPAVATPEIFLSDTTLRPGEELRVQYQACAGPGLGEAELALQTSEKGGTWVVEARHEQLTLAPCEDRFKKYTYDGNDVGKEFCFRSRVTPASTESNADKFSSAKCARVIDQPYIEILGGDAVAGIGYTADQSCARFGNAPIQAASSASVGSLSEYAVRASGFIDDFGSGDDHQGTDLTMSNDDLNNLGDFNNGDCGPLPVFGAVSAGPVTLTRLTADEITEFSVDGDLFITGDLLAQTDSADPENPPIFLISVTGNVFIAPEVNQINAVIVSEGSIVTCADIQNAKIERGSALCREPLLINGAIAANYIHFGRTGGGLAAGGPSEIVRRPAWLDQSTVGRVNGARTTDIDQFKDLPPVLGLE